VGYINCLLISIVLLVVSCGVKDSNSPISSNKNSVWNEARKITSLSQIKAAPKVGEWLATYSEEYQSFSDYIASNPPAMKFANGKMYVVQLGKFDSSANVIFNRTKDYMSVFFAVDIVVLPPITIEHIPDSFTRHGQIGFQVNSRYVLDTLLPRLLPKDALSLIAFTCTDLYPQDDWNFVFGQASLVNRVGVWSMARLGNYSVNEKEYRACLLRTMHVAVHETGHMLSIPHCTQYNCCMNGSNSLEESDRQPSWFCWECLAKMCAARGIEPKQHVRSMASFFKQLSFAEEELRYYHEALALMRK